MVQTNFVLDLRQKISPRKILPPQKRISKKKKDNAKNNKIFSAKIMDLPKIATPSSSPSLRKSLPPDLLFRVLYTGKWHVGGSRISNVLDAGTLHVRGSKMSHVPHAGKLHLRGSAISNVLHASTLHVSPCWYQWK